jgi:subtilase family serine protease
VQPDLTITDFTASVSGDSVTYTIKTCNVGQTAAGTFYVDLYYDRTTPPGPSVFGDQFNTYNALAPGACVTTALSRANTPAGTYSSWTQVDADGIVGESDETNNTEGPLSVTVSSPPPPGGPDLTIQNVETTIYGSIAVTVRYRFTICNLGNQASGATEVHLYHDRTTPPPQGMAGDQQTTVPGIQPGGCTSRNIYRLNVPQGTYSSYGQVDPQDQVKESDETNNIYGPVKVTVGTTPGADLTIKSFTHNIYQLGTVRYRVQICNVGTGTSGTTQVHIYYDQNVPPKQGQAGDLLTAVSMLQPGSCVFRNVYRLATPTGTYSSWAQVDPANLVTETDENNNVAGPLAVTVAP